MSTPPDDYRAPVTTVCVLSGWDPVTGHPSTEERWRRIVELAKAGRKEPADEPAPAQSSGPGR